MRHLFEQYQPKIVKAQQVSPILFGLLAVLLLAPTAVFATHLEIARLATQLNMVSGQLAYELRGAGAYSSIRQRSEHLSREAADLADAVRRERSSTHVQSQFRDVSQRFASLEQAFLRLNRRDFSPYLFNEFDRISGIYTSLSAELHYAGVDEYASPLVYNSREYGARSYGPRTYVPGTYVPDTYAPPVIIYQPVPVPDYRIPPGFTTPTASRHLREPNNEHEQRATGRRPQQQQLPNFDHRSAVLDRQSRLDNRRGDSARDRPSGTVETSRRNHFE